LRLSLRTQETTEQRITSVVVTGVPQDVQLSAGTRNSNGTISLAADELANLKLTGSFSEDFAIQVRTNYSQIKTLYQEDFEQGAGGWSANTVQSAERELTTFLGRFNELHDGVSVEARNHRKDFCDLQRCQRGVC
jgi:hypothetical protein